MRNLRAGVCVNIVWEEALRAVEKMSEVQEARFSKRDLETLMQTADRVRESIETLGHTDAYSVKDMEDMAIAQLKREGKLRVE